MEAKSIGHPRVKVISSCKSLNMDVEKQIQFINKSSKYMLLVTQSYLQCLILLFKIFLASLYPVEEWGPVRRPYKSI